MNKIEIKETRSRGLGLFATEDIENQTQIISIPEDRFITCRLLEVFHQFSNLFHNTNTNMKVLFAYFLSAMSLIPYDQTHQYFFVMEYISQLPKEIHGFVTWELEELQAINDKQLVKRIIDKKQVIKASYALISKQVKSVWQAVSSQWQYRLFTEQKQISLITFDLLLKFYSVIESRSVWYQQYHQVGALVPIIDKLNHSDLPNCIVELGANYSIKSLRKIVKGEELTVSYGNFTHGQFLEYYGFLNFPLQIEIEKAEKLSKREYRKKIAQIYNSHHRKNYTNARSNINHCKKQQKFQP